MRFSDDAKISWDSPKSHRYGDQTISACISELSWPDLQTEPAYLRAYLHETDICPYILLMPSQAPPRVDIEPTPEFVDSDCSS